MAVTAVLLIGYNIAAVLDQTPDNTISAVIWSWTERYPVVAVLFGIVCGHLFWPPRRRVPALGPWLLLVWGVVAAAANYFGLFTNVPPALALLGGFGLGAWLWGRENERKLRS